MIQVRIGDEVVVVNTRMERLIRWLLKKAARIDALEQCRITINCARGGIRAELIECEQVD